MGCGTSSRKKELRQKLKPMKLKEFIKEVSQGNKLILFEDYVLDAVGLSLSQPGGPLDFVNCAGMEVSRYVYGCATLPGKTTYPCTEQTLAKIKDFAIGKLYNPHTDTFFLKSDSTEKAGNKYWHLEGRTPLTSEHSIFRFFRNGTNVLAMPSCIDLYGKYLTVRVEELKQTRIYALCFTLSPIVYPYLMDMVTAFQRRKPYYSKFVSIGNTHKPYVELIIKKQTNVSKYLHEMPLVFHKNVPLPENRFTIRGPFGKGFCMKPTQGGTVVGIALGTSVTMFADLASYILRKNIYKAAKVIKTVYKLFANETFEFLDDDSFKLVLMSSFHKREEVIGKELFEKAEAVSKDFMFGNFEYHLRVGEEGTPRWNKEFFKAHIDGMASRVYVCGPSFAVQSIKEMLEEIGISRENIWEL